MFYEMILFCSLAEVVGAIISLAEINTGKANHFSGAAAAGVPHCHLATRALEAEAAGLCWLREPPAPVPTAGQHTWTWDPLSFSWFTAKLENCKTSWSIKDRCRKTRGKGKNSTTKKCKMNLALLGKAVFYTEAHRFSSSIAAVTAAAHKATTASSSSAVITWMSVAKWWAGRNSEHYLVPWRQAWI